MAIIKEEGEGERKNIDHHIDVYVYLEEKGTTLSESGLSSPCLLQEARKSNAIVKHVKQYRMFIRGGPRPP